MSPVIAFSLALTILLAALLLLVLLRRRNPVSKLATKPKVLDWQGMVDEELNRLRGQGIEVFHNFTSGRFTIDHILVGRRGVFVLESNSLAPFVRRQAEPDATVLYEDGALHFSKHANKEPAERAWRHANWISGRLSRRAGVPVRALPLVVLSGWKIQQRGKSPVRVIELQRLAAFVTGSKLQMFSDAELQRVTGLLREGTGEFAAVGGKR